MNKRIHRVFSMILVLAMVAALACSAFAVQDASDYFSSKTASASALGGGDVKFRFDVTGTGIMDQIGFKQIKVYEQQSNGTFKCVETLNENDHGFLFTNRMYAEGSYTYEGTPGIKYYANIQFYCKDSNGSESDYKNTNTVTA